VHTVFDEANTGVDGINAINFAKWVQFYTYIKNVLRHELPDISDNHWSKAGALAYLNGQLSTISTTDRDLGNRSGELLRQEENIRQRGRKSLRFRQLIRV
jgi:hypothetical protein